MARVNIVMFAHVCSKKQIAKLCILIQVDQLSEVFSF